MDRPDLGTVGFISGRDIRVEIANFNDYRTGDIRYTCGTNPWDRVPPLDRCWTNAIEIDSDSHRDPQQILRHLAQAYVVHTLSSPANAKIGIAYLYFANLAEGGNNCVARRMFADTLTSLVFPDSEYIYSSWDRCTTTPSEITPEAQTVVRSALDRTTAQWFLTTYAGPNNRLDNSELEALWSEIRTIPRDPDRKVIVYYLHLMFGGYCEPLTVVRRSAFSFNRPPVRNPWRGADNDALLHHPAGGCVPSRVSVATTVDGNQITLTWTAPQYDGGSPITRYTIQWRATGQQYDTTRQQVHTDLTDLTYTISGLDQNTDYTIRIAAHNQAFTQTPNQATTIATTRDSNPPTQLEEQSEQQLTDDDPPPDENPPDENPPPDLPL